MNIKKVLISMLSVSIFAIHCFGSTKSYYTKDGVKHTSISSPSKILIVPNGSDEMGFYCKNTTGKSQLWTKEIITVSPQCFETLTDDRDFKTKKIGANVVEVTYNIATNTSDKIDAVWELRYHKGDKIKTLIGFKGCERQWDRIKSKHEMYVSTSKGGEYKKMCEADFSYQIQRELFDASR